MVKIEESHKNNETTYIISQKTYKIVIFIQMILSFIVFLLWYILFDDYLFILSYLAFHTILTSIFHFSVGYIINWFRKEFMSGESLSEHFVFVFLSFMIYAVLFVNPNDFLILLFKLMLVLELMYFLSIFYAFLLDRHFLVYDIMSLVISLIIFEILFSYKEAINVLFFLSIPLTFITLILLIKYKKI